MNVLLLYEDSPETISAFFIQNPSKDELKTLEMANGTCVNDLNQSTINVIGACGIDCDKNVDHGWIGKWKKCKIETPVLQKTILQSERIFCIGFMI